MSVFPSECLALVAGLVAFLWVGCHSTPPPPAHAPPIVVEPGPAAAPVPVEVRVDDIPADAPPAIRAHLIKLREMRDLGQMTEGEYQSRKAALWGK
jgi:hypothetical protein